MDICLGAKRNETGGVSWEIWSKRQEQVKIMKRVFVYSEKRGGNMLR